MAKTTSIKTKKITNHKLEAALLATSKFHPNATDRLIDEMYQKAVREINQDEINQDKDLAQKEEMQDDNLPEAVVTIANAEIYAAENLGETIDNIDADAAGIAYVASAEHKVVPFWQLALGAIAIGGVGYAIFHDNDGGAPVPVDACDLFDNTVFGAFIERAEGLDAAQITASSDITIDFLDGVDLGLYDTETLMSNDFDFLLSPNFSYSVNGADVDAAGLQVNLVQGEDTDIDVNLNFNDIDADGVENNTLFLAHMDVQGQDLSADVYVNFDANDVRASDHGVATVGIYSANVDIETSGVIDFEMALTADANSHGTASILIENLNINLVAGDVDVNTNVEISANATDFAYAEIKICDINISVEGADANFSFTSIDAFAADYATALVDIHNIAISAVANDSDGATAYAGLAYVSAEADDSAHATVLIDTISIYAEANNTAAETTSQASAEAMMETISANAFDGGVALIDIGSIDIKAVAHDGTAYAAITESIDVDAGEYGIAELNIDTINIGAEGGYASAYIESISMDANDHGQAILDIGEINITAEASTDYAQADIQDDIDLEARNFGEIDLNIDSLNITAIANAENQNAVAEIEDGIDIDVYDDAHINATIDNISIFADGQYNATAQLDDNITVRGEDNGQASLFIDSLDINAVASSGDARAILASNNNYYNFGIQVVNDTASDNANTLLTINNINLSANAGEDAFAQVSQFTVNADDGMATLDIGNVIISANAEGDAFAGFTDHASLSASDAIVRQMEYNLDDSYERNISAVAQNNAQVLLAIDKLDISAVGADYAKAEIYDVQLSAFNDSNASITIEELNIRAEGLNGDADAYADQFSAYASGDANAIIDIGSINITASAQSDSNYADAYAHVHRIEISAYNDAEVKIYIDEINISALATSTANAYLDNMEVFANDDVNVSIDIGQVQIKAISSEDEAWANYDMRLNAEEFATVDGDIDSISLTASGTSYAFAYLENIDVVADDSSDINLNVDAINVVASADNGDAIARAVGFVVDVSDDAIADLTIGDVSLRSAGDSALAVVEDISAYAWNEGEDNYTLAKLEVGDLSLEATADGQSGDADAFINDINAEAYDDGTAIVDIGRISINANANDSSADAEAGINRIEAFAYDSNSSNARITIENIHISAVGTEGVPAAAGIGHIYAEATSGDNEAFIGIGDITISASGASAYASLGALGEDEDGIVAFVQERGDAVIDLGNVNMSARADNSASAYVAAIVASVDFGSSIATTEINLDNLAAITIQDINIEAIAESGDATIVIDRIEARAENWVDVNYTDFTYDFNGSDPGGVVTYTKPWLETTAYVLGATDYQDQAYATVDIGDVTLHAEGENASIELNVLAVAGHTVDDLQPEKFEEGFFEDGIQSTPYAFATVHIGDVNLTAIGADQDAEASVLFTAGVRDQGLDDGTDVWNGQAEMYIGAVNVTANTATLSFTLDNPLNESYLSIRNIELNVLGTDSANSLYIGGNVDNNNTWAIGTDNIDVGHILAHVENTDATLSIEVNNVDWDEDRQLILSGDGGIEVDIDQIENTAAERTMVFGHIDLSDFTGTVNFNFGSGSYDYDLDETTNIEDIEFTSILGFDLNNSASISFGSADVGIANFLDIGTRDNLANLKTDLYSALNGTRQYVFALFDEASYDYDLNDDGQKQDALGVLAYDLDGVGITSLVYFVDNVDNVNYNTL